MHLTHLIIQVQKTQNTLIFPPYTPQQGEGIRNRGARAPPPTPSDSASPPHRLSVPEAFSWRRCKQVPLLLSGSQSAAPLSQLESVARRDLGESPQEPSATDRPETRPAVTAAHLDGRDTRGGFRKRATYHRVPLCHRPRHLVETVQRALSLDRLEKEEGELQEGRTRLRRACQALAKRRPELNWQGSGEREGAGGGGTGAGANLGCPEPGIREAFSAKPPAGYAARGWGCSSSSSRSGAVEDEDAKPAGCSAPLALQRALARISGSPVLKGAGRDRR